MFPFTLAGTYTEANRLCRTLEVVKQKTMQKCILKSKSTGGNYFFQTMQMTPEVENQELCDVF